MWPEIANARVRVRDSAYRLDLQRALGCSAIFYYFCYEWVLDNHVRPSHLILIIVEALRWSLYVVSYWSKFPVTYSLYVRIRFEESISVAKLGFFEIGVRRVLSGGVVVGGGCSQGE